MNENIEKEKKSLFKGFFFALKKTVNPKKKQFGLCIFLVALIPFFASDAATADILGSFRDAFFAQVSDYVNNIVNDSTNGLHTWMWSIFVFLVFCKLVLMVVNFINNGLKAHDAIEHSIWIFSTLALLVFFDFFTSMLWQATDGLATSYQVALTNNSDTLYMSHWFKKAMASISTGDTSIWDDMKKIVIIGFLYFFQLCLEIVVFIGAIWAQWGYAVSKLIGLIFIPFLVVEYTRSLFDNWFKFFTGFLVLNVMLRVTTVVAALGYKAVIEGYGVIFSGPSTLGMVTNAVYIEDMGVVLEIVIVTAVATLFVLSSFVYAGSLGASGGNMSAGLGKGVQSAARFIATKFVL